MNFSPIKIPFKIDLPSIQTETRKLYRFFVTYSRNLQPIDDGVVKIIPLNSPAGEKKYFDSDPNGKAYKSTSYLQKSPAIKALLDRIPGKLMSVRLILITPGCRIITHRDNFRNVHAGVIRLHIPVITNKKSHMIFSGKRFHWKAGELWLGDFSQKHSVINSGTTERIHLVIDFIPEKKFLNLSPRLIRFAHHLKFNVIHADRKLTPKDISGKVRSFKIPPHFLTDIQKPVKAKIVVRERELFLIVKGKKQKLFKVGKNTFRVADYIPTRLIRIEEPFVYFQFSGVVTNKGVLDFSVKNLIDGE